MNKIKKIIFLLKQAYEYVIFTFADFLVFVYITFLRLYYKIYWSNRMIDFRRFSPWYKRYDALLYKYQKTSEFIKAHKNDLMLSYKTGDLELELREMHWLWKEKKKQQIFDFFEALIKIVLSFIALTIVTVLIINNDTTWPFTFWMDIPFPVDNWEDYNILKDLYNNPAEFELPIPEYEYFDEEDPNDTWLCTNEWWLYIYMRLDDFFDPIEYVLKDPNFSELCPVIDNPFGPCVDFDKFFKDGYVLTLEELNDFLDKDIEYGYEGFCIENDLDIAEKNAKLLDKNEVLLTSKKNK